MMNQNRYGYVIGLLILLVLVVGGLISARSKTSSDPRLQAYVSEETVRLSQDGFVKTYRNPQVGFSFDYPATFYVQAPSFPEEYLRDESLSDEQREEKSQNDTAVWRQLLAKINEGVVRGEGSAYKEIDVSVMDPNDLPTRAEEKENCEELKRLNPKLSPQEVCVVSSPTREDLQEEQDSIMSGVVGERTATLSKTLLGGVIVETGNVRGIRDLAMSSDTGDSVATFSAYTPDGKRITLSLWLAQDAPLDSVFSTEAERQQKAIEDPRNSAFDRTVFSFKFL